MSLASHVKRIPFAKRLNRTSLAKRIKDYIRSLPRYAETLLYYYTQDQKPIISYWWREKKNVGDLIGPFLLSEIFGRGVVHIEDLPLQPRGRDVIVTVGSIIQQIDFARPYICGTGIIDPNRVPKLTQPQIHSVRGPKTREALQSHGYHCPESYGDLGLLIGRYTQVAGADEDTDDHQKSVGVVLHHSDTEVASRLRNTSDQYKLISVRSEVPQFVARMKSCRLVVSSSLHGIITAHALGIPAVWLRKIGNKTGGAFKYHDYFASFGAEAKYINVDALDAADDLLSCLEGKEIAPPPSSFIDKIEENLLLLRQ